MTETNGRGRAYGLAEIAEALGVTPAAVSVWARQGTHGMPEPDWHLRCGPVWTHETLGEWLDDQREQRGVAA